MWRATPADAAAAVAAKDRGVDRGAGQKFRALVDLDNIAFREGVFDPGCAAHRMEAVLEVASLPRARHVESFCNVKTRDHLRKKNVAVPGKLQVSERVTKDSADHLLLARYIDAHLRRHKRSSSVPLLVVTHDKNLARMVNYHTPPTAMHVLYFGLFGKASSSCEKLDIHPAERFALSFNDRRDLDGFVASLSRFEKVT